MGHLHCYVTVSVLILGMPGVWDLHTEWLDLHNRRVHVCLWPTQYARIFRYDLMNNVK